MNSCRHVALFALLFAIPLATLAADQEDPAAKKKKGGPQSPPAITNLNKQLEGLTLTDDQAAKVKAILAEYSPKLSDAQKKVSGILTAEQRKARSDASSKAKADGKKGKEIQEAVAAATNSTAEQKESLATAEAAVKDLTTALRKAAAGVLTDEQKSKAGLDGPKKGKKKIARQRARRRADSFVHSTPRLWPTAGVVSFLP